jgi:hypothetical protein
VRYLCFLLLGALLPVSGRADSDADNARRARALLGPEVWSQLIRVENSRPGRPYPAVVHALVFELEDALWFYTARDGTQSLSQYLGRTAADEANLGPLLRAIDPGFGGWAPELAEPLPATISLELANGCFIQSIALLRARLARGLVAGSPRLLSYYVDTPTGRRGHTVLEYVGEGGLRILDPARPTHPLTLRIAPEASPQAQARLLRPDIALARCLPLREFGRRLLLASAGRAAPRIVVS